MMSFVCKLKFVLSKDTAKLDKFASIFSRYIFRFRTEEMKKYGRDVGTKTIKLLVSQFEDIFGNNLLTLKFDNNEKIVLQKDLKESCNPFTSNHLVSNGTLEMILFKMLDKYYTHIIGIIIFIFLAKKKKEIMNLKYRE